MGHMGPVIGNEQWVLEGEQQNALFVSITVRIRNELFVLVFEFKKKKRIPKAEPANSYLGGSKMVKIYSQNSQRID